MFAVIMVITPSDTMVYSTRWYKGPAHGKTKTKNEGQENGCIFSSSLNRYIFLYTAYAIKNYFDYQNLAT